MKNIPLKDGYVAVVDDVDYARLQAFGNWTRNNRGYAVCYRSVDGRRFTFYMHRIVIQAKPGTQVDHIDRDKLNNQRRNLRLVSRTQNQMNKGLQANNSTGVKGVTLRKGKYEARLRYQDRNLYLGRYESADEAGLAYDIAARYLYGHYAWCNHPAPSQTVEMIRRQRQVRFRVDRLLGRR
jgi:hypothetical protein